MCANVVGWCSSRPTAGGVQPDRSGTFAAAVTVRRWCGLAVGDRVLLAAEPADGLLVVYPPATLDAMIIQLHARALGGDIG
jgi:hypothetical protein